MLNQVKPYEVFTARQNMTKLILLQALVAAQDYNIKQIPFAELIKVSYNFVNECGEADFIVTAGFMWNVVNIVENEGGNTLRSKP